MWYEHGDFMIWIDADKNESDEELKKKAIENLKLWLDGKL